MAITHHIMIILVSLLVISVSAVTPPAKLKPTQTVPVSAEDFTAAHNDYRATVYLPPFVWSQTLEAAAIRLARYQRNKRKCEYASLKYPSKYGANQLRVEGRFLTTIMTPSQTVLSWANEMGYYDYKSNTCTPNHTCRDFVQLFWRKSKEVGCAQARCVKESTFFFFWKIKEPTVLTICLYNPPANLPKP
ncbi:hypothetical protein AALP_AA8G502400 [Arabis alpina]|uniref:SCP domain-containing protein n=1 Tax=Arabis alpina TaxID=50452 RepID=A0A087GEN1_ARAAL|nr:hypothetical protein AALP_AA8G502400 [Arabis alpina]